MASLLPSNSENSGKVQVLASSIPGLPPGELDLRLDIRAEIMACHELREEANKVKNTLSTLLPKIEKMEQRIMGLKLRELELEHMLLGSEIRISTKRSSIRSMEYSNLYSTEQIESEKNALFETSRKCIQLQGFVQHEKQEIEEAIKREINSSDYKLVFDTVNEKNKLLSLEEKIISEDNLELALKIRLASQVGSRLIGPEKEGIISDVMASLESAKSAKDEAFAAIRAAEIALGVIKNLCSSANLG